MFLNNYNYFMALFIAMTMNFNYSSDFELCFQTFFSFPRWFVPNVDGKVLTDTPENLLTQGKFAKVPIMTGQNKDAGAFYYRLTLNTFNGGNYDDNFIDHKLPRMLPTITSFNSKLYPITRQVRKRYFVNADLEDEDEFRPRYSEVS